MNFFGIGGNLVRQPEIGHTSGGKDFVSFSLAHNHSKENVSFYDCVSWDEKIIEKLVHAETGQRVEATGWLKQERWQNKDGKNRTKIKFMVEKLQTWPKRNRGSNDTTFDESAPKNEASKPSDARIEAVEDIFQPKKA